MKPPGSNRRNRLPEDRRQRVCRAMFQACLVSVLLTVAGCGQEAPPATVEGTLTIAGEPLDNCLITFLPDTDAESPGPHSTAVTDEKGRYRLRLADQREGASVGPHRITVQDLSVSTGVRRRDHGTVDAGSEEDATTPVRRSRVPPQYGSLAETPLKRSVQRGSQRIDLDIP